MNWLIFPSAVHTRLAHCLGAYAATVELTKMWLEMGFITKNQAKALCAFALYHNIGHPPFSHVTEPLCKNNNDGLGLQIIEDLKKEIESCDVDFDFFKKLFAHQHPLYLAVHDKNLGMEKLDYLQRDGLYTSVGKPDSVDYLKRHIYFINNQMMIDQKAISNARRVQQFYMMMYKEVYMRKGSVIAQRMMQKMAHGLMMENELTQDELPKLNDIELLAKLSVSKNRLVKYLYHLLMSRNLFKEAIVVCYQKYVPFYRIAGKPIKLIGIDEKPGRKTGVMAQFINSSKINAKNPVALLEIENCFKHIHMAD